MVNLGLKVAQRHAVLFEEPEEMLARDPSILRAGNAISSQAARIEPLAHGAGRDLADLRDLTGGEHFFHIEDSTRFNQDWRETSEDGGPSGGLPTSRRWGDPPQTLVART